MDLKGNEEPDSNMFQKHNIHLFYHHFLYFFILCFIISCCADAHNKKIKDLSFDRSLWWSIWDSNPWPLHCQCSALANWANAPGMVLRAGLEPATPAMWTRCSNQLSQRSISFRPEHSTPSKYFCQAFYKIKSARPPPERDFGAGRRPVFCFVMLNFWAHKTCTHTFNTAYDP